jgi:hypothetical protein
MRLQVACRPFPVHVYLQLPRVVMLRVLIKAAALAAATWMTDLLRRG